MSLINCIECDAEISDTATACPKCGARTKKKSSALPIVVGAALFVLAYFITRGATYSDAEREMDAAENSISHCREILKRLPDKSSEFAIMQDKCDKQTRSYRQSYGREP